MAACTAAEPAPVEDDLAGAVRTDFGHGVTGVAATPAPDTDQVPAYQLFAGDRALDITAVDAAVDTATGTLVWVDPQGTLWAAAVTDAPAGARQLATDVILGLATSRGRLAFARRHDGPETAPFVVDLGTGRVDALDDGPGPDEVLGFSPDGSEVLLLSGRTGVASLFAADASGTAASRQLTNVGLRPGPAFDLDRFQPPPAHHRDVAWTSAGVRYRAGERLVEVRR